MKHPLPTASTSSNASSTSEQWTAVSTGQRQTSIIDFSKRPVTDKRRQQITDLLINFVVKDVRPLSALSGEGFRDIMKFFEPGYKIPVTCYTLEQHHASVQHCESEDCK
ncbi:hypothetical protein KUCAC02_031359 [Chaenocephalus aceratus]|nr:hypothetical protein KUCAC02_031359 [Chaenocephalus aceratus]